MELADQLGLVARLRDLGVLGALFLMVVGGFRGWYVWRWQYEEQKEQTRRAIAERDEWAAIVKESMEVADHALRKRVS